MGDDFLTEAEAVEKFGSLTEETDLDMRVYIRFETPEGVWQPEFDFWLNFVGYRLERQCFQ